MSEFSSDSDDNKAEKRFTGIRLFEPGEEKEGKYLRKFISNNTVVNRRMKHIYNKQD